MQLLRELNPALIESARPSLPDRLEGIAELRKYECFALDGHWHQGATHDPRHKGAKVCVGHFYGLDLRRHTLRHLAVGEGLHEHDMSALKRVKPTGLRQGVAQGTRVLIVYDKARIDFSFWKRCRHECGVYFLSRVKEGMVYDLLERRVVEAQDPRNRGVSEDLLIASREGHRMRIIRYTDPVSGEAFEFLTNEPDLTAGVLVELYRRRWEAEKVFDEIKNKLGEKKAWGTSQETRESQAQFIAITHNLMMLYESRLEEDHGVTNEVEDRRRARRVVEAQAACQASGQALSTLVTAVRRTTQRSVKFVRWVRQSLRDQTTEAIAVPRLKALYTTW